MTDLVLAIDNGSQSTKVSIVDAAGVVHASAVRKLRPYDTPAPGRVVHPGDDLWDSIAGACLDAVAAFGGDRSRIVAVGLCTIRFCRAYLDENGLLTEPVLSWMDERVSRAYEAVDPRVRHVTTSSGYITHRLTGRFRDTAANYQGVWPINQDSWRWSADPSAYAATGMSRELLLELVDPGDVLGTVTDAAAAATGLPVGIPVVATANDKAVEAIGSGVWTEGTALLSLGTYIACMTPGFSALAGNDDYWMNFASVPGEYLYESGGIRRGMWTVSWYRDLIGPISEDELNAGAALVEPGSDGLFTILDWLAPGSAPYRRGAMLGFDGRQGRFHLYRSILEGIAFTMAGHLEAMEGALGRCSETLVVSGGGSRSELMMQILADVFGRPVTRTLHTDAAGLGAAICAAVGVGLHPGWSEAIEAMVHTADRFEPDPARSIRYRELAARYAGITEHTDPLFRALAE